MSEAFRVTGSLQDETLSDLLWQHGCTALWQDGEVLVAYFPERLKLPVQGTWASADTTDYLAQYYAELKPVVFNELVVAPTHAQVTLSAPQQVIWLDPGMAFGTGHHETTFMALATLCQTPLTGKTVLDVGSGSGILAIAASKLGAQDILGIDIDPETLPVAEANRDLNRAAARFELGTLADIPDGFADVIIANLYAELHISLVHDYTRVLKPGGALMITGILADKAPEVTAALEPWLSVSATVGKGEWVLIAARSRR
jgi:ribosomal protein L11 methyltransferase